MEPTSGQVAKRAIELTADAVVAGKYRLVRPAGFGGMAQLWVAKNEATGAEVCVKVLLYARDSADEAIDRFRREAHAAARLSHRGIVRVFDLVEIDDGLVIVMELLQGEPLFDRIAREGKLSVDAALDIALPVLSALAYAHLAGVVHRDLKPDNVFLAREPDGEVTPKILDFGVSKLLTPGVPRITTDGASLGTPAYMSPEQARASADTDARSDVFAMGIVLYEMLTGENPFASASYHSVVAAILERDPTLPAGVPEPLGRVVLRALEKKRENRWRDARAFADALRATRGRGDDARGAKIEPALSQVSVPPVAPAIEEPPLVEPRSSRSRTFLAAAVIAGVGAVIAAAGAALIATRSVRSGTFGAGASDSTSSAPVLATSAPLAAPAMPSAPLVPADAPVLAISAPSASSAPRAPRSPAPPRSIASSVASSVAPSVAPAAHPARTADPSVLRNPGF